MFSRFLVDCWKRLLAIRHKGRRNSGTYSLFLGLLRTIFIPALSRLNRMLQLHCDASPPTQIHSSQNRMKVLVITIDLRLSKTQKTTWDILPIPAITGPG